MWWLIEVFFGNDRWWINLNFLGDFLGIRFNGDIWMFGKGGV